MHQYKKPLNIEITTPENEVFLAVFKEQLDYNIGDYRYHGELKLHVEPALIGTAWQDEMDEPGERSFDLHNLYEWISSAICEGGEIEEKSQSIEGLSFKVTNAEDVGMDATLDVTVFGELAALAEVKNNMISLEQEELERQRRSDFPPMAYCDGLEFSDDVLVVSDPTIAKAIQESFPNLPNIDVSLDYVTEQNYDISHKKSNTYLFKAAAIETARQSGLKLQYLSPEALKNNMHATMSLPTSTKNQLSLIAEEAIDVTMFMKHVESLTSESAVSRLISNAESILAGERAAFAQDGNVSKQLPFVDFDSQIEERQVELYLPDGAVKGVAYYEKLSGDAGEKMLGVASQQGDDTLVYKGEFNHATNLIRNDDANNTKETLSNSLKR